jgi:hypothetical protein
MPSNGSFVLNLTKLCRSVQSVRHRTEARSTTRYSGEFALGGPQHLIILCRQKLRQIFQERSTMADKDEEREGGGQSGSKGGEKSGGGKSGSGKKGSGKEAGGRGGSQGGSGRSGSGNR